MDEYAPYVHTYMPFKYFRFQLRVVFTPVLSSHQNCIAAESVSDTDSAAMQL